MKKLSRRTILQGAGACLGLPLLEAMRPTSALAASAQAKAPVRMAFVFFPNGAVMPSWKPSGEGADHQLSPTLKTLGPHKSEINIFSGLAQDNGRAKGDGAGDHARCASSYLTGAHPVKTSGADIRVGVSVDQLAAEKVGHRTRFASLELGVERGRNAGSCDSGYSCAYSSNVSWKTPTTPMAKEIHPRLVFERLFGGRDQDARRAARRRSVLDLVKEDAAQLVRRLGQSDRRKMDEYLGSVRELEKRIANNSHGATAPPPEMDLPEGAPEDLQQHIRLMYDLLAVALQTDMSRVATFMLANAGSNRSYTMVGVNDGHHSLSHHRNQEKNLSQLRRIDEFLVTEFGGFLTKLRAIQEGEGTLLDNCMIMYGSGLGDGNRHNHHDLPVLMAGRGGGAIQPGRHIVQPSETPLNNLFLSMLDIMEADVVSFGDSTGRLSLS